MRYAKITYPDINNGIGCRVTLWVSGCSHKCPGCHNPELHDKMYGNFFNMDSKEELFSILSKPYIKGLTISGGDPFDLANKSTVNILIKEIKERFPTKDIWIYTGATLSIEDFIYNDYYKYMDVIVDGPYIEAQKDLSLPFKGSFNQRIIDVQESIKTGKIILFK